MRPLGLDDAFSEQLLALTPARLVARPRHSGTEVNLMAIGTALHHTQSETIVVLEPAPAAGSSAPVITELRPRCDAAGAASAVDEVMTSRPAIGGAQAKTGSAPT